MDREMTVADLMSALRDEIAQRQALLAEIEARVTPKTETPRRERGGAGRAAVDVLREAGRPMHGSGEIWPALQARGIHLSSRSGFATMLLRTGKIIRTAPGMFAIKPDSVPVGF